MGKRGGGVSSKRPPPANMLTGSNKSIALSTKSRNHNPRSLLKLEHLQNLASWAGEEASIPSLAVIFGRQFSSSTEVLGVPLDPSALFQCQRCETILQPGFNCTIRIEKNRAKARCRHKKFSTLTKNNVVYKCHFCSHLNRKRGTPKGHMKEICPPKAKPPAKSKTAKSILQKSANLEEGTSSKDEIVKIDETTLPAISVDSSVTNSPVNPFPRIETNKIDETALHAISLDASIMNSPATPFSRVVTDGIIKIDEIGVAAISTSTTITNSPSTPQPSSGFSLLDAKKRKRNRAAKKLEQSESSSAAKDTGKTVSSISSKRKRKCWTSLKEIVEKRTL